MKNITLSVVAIILLVAFHAIDVEAGARKDQAREILLKAVFESGVRYGEAIDTGNMICREAKGSRVCFLKSYCEGESANTQYIDAMCEQVKEQKQ